MNSFNSIVLKKDCYEVDGEFVELDFLSVSGVSAFCSKSFYKGDNITIEHDTFDCNRDDRENCIFFCQYFEDDEWKDYKLYKGFSKAKLSMAILAKRHEKVKYERLDI